MKTTELLHAHDEQSPKDPFLASLENAIRNSVEKLNAEACEQPQQEYDWWNNYFIWVLILSVPVYTFITIIVQRYQLQKRLILQQQQQAQLELKRSDNFVLTILNGTIQPLIHQASWLRGLSHGDFQLDFPNRDLPLERVSPQNGDCSLPGNQFRQVYIATLQKYLNVSVDSITGQLTCQVQLPKDNETLLRAQKLLLTELKSELLKIFVLLPEYQHQQNLKAQATQLAFEKQRQLALSKWLSDLNKVQLISKQKRSEIMSVIATLTEKDYSTNERLKKQSEKLMELLEKFSPRSIQSDLDEMVPMQGGQGPKNLQQIQSTQLDPIAYQLELKNQLEYLEELIKKHRAHQLKQPVELNQIQQAIVARRQSREFEQAQRKQQQILELEAAQKHKESFQEQQALKKRSQEEQRIRKQEAEQRKRAYQLRLLSEQTKPAVSIRPLLRASSWSVSSSSDDQIREKVVTLGDLAQRYNQLTNPDDIQKMEFKFAMLSQCLRLFELTYQYSKANLAKRIRNTLMHRHRYLVQESLNEFVNLIAHQPSAHSTSEVTKLEDVLIQLSEQRSDEKLNALNFALQQLETCEFCQVLLQAEQEVAAEIVYLQSMHYLLSDLASIKTKENVRLEQLPDKVLAVKGILICIGECYQQIDRQNLQNLSRNFLGLLRYSQELRENMGHAANETTEDIRRYETFIRHAEDHANELNVLLGYEQISSYTTL